MKDTTGAPNTALTTEKELRTILAVLSNADQRTIHLVCRFLMALL